MKNKEKLEIMKKIYEEEKLYAILFGGNVEKLFNDKGEDNNGKKEILQRNFN